MFSHQFSIDPEGDQRIKMLKLLEAKLNSKKTDSSQRNSVHGLSHKNNSSDLASEVLNQIESLKQFMIKNLVAKMDNLESNMEQLKHFQSQQMSSPFWFASR